MDDRTTCVVRARDALERARACSFHPDLGASILSVWSHYQQLSNIGQPLFLVDVVDVQGTSAHLEVGGRFMLDARA